MSPGVGMCNDPNGMLEGALSILNKLKAEHVVSFLKDDAEKAFHWELGPMVSGFHTCNQRPILERWNSYLTKWVLGVLTLRVS